MQSVHYFGLSKIQFTPAAGQCLEAPGSAGLIGLQIALAYGSQLAKPRHEALLVHSFDKL